MELISPNVPTRYAVNNGGMVGGTPGNDYYGWNLSDNSSWVNRTGDGSRSSFTKGWEPSLWLSLRSLDFLAERMPSIAI